MINLRYHIVSITAVFLALGIGLAFGAAFIDRATVDALNSNLTQIEQQNDQLEQANDELSQQVLDAAAIDLGLRGQALPQVVAGRLDQVPVLTIASEGVDDAVVEQAEAAVLDAGAQMAAVVRVTDRFALDDESELDDLRTVLDLPNAGADQLRTATVRRLRTLLAAAAQPLEEDDASASVIDPVQVPTPELIQALADAGFLEIDPTDEPPAAFALLPERGLRLLVVSGPDGAVAEEALVMPLVAALVTPSVTAPDAPVPLVVAVQPVIRPPGDEEVDPPPPFVTALRSDEAMRSQLSTVDHLDTFSGLLATVLAVQYGGEGQLGHYGTDDDAQTLVPLEPTATGSED
jgi:hypothetical protein